MEQIDYAQRFIDFLENFQDDNGKYKYRKLAEKMGIMGETRFEVDVKDLEKYDKELARAYKEKLPNIKSRLDEIIEWFIKTRTLLARGWLEGAMLKNEKEKEVVILTSDFVREIVREMNVPLTLEELAKILGWEYRKVKQGNVTHEFLVVDFVKFIRFLVSKR